MAITLFLKECKETAKSITYYIFLICVSVFFITQMGSVEPVKKPIQGEESYGWKYSEDESVIMKSALERILFELSYNSFGTYPIGFYKQVTLNEKEQKDIYSALENIAGMDSNQIQQAVNEYGSSMDSSAIESISIRQDLSYEEFCDVFNRIDKILGGGSDYNEQRLYLHARVDKTYEDAVEDYKSIIEKDYVSGAYARLYSDYMGIILAILPIFLAVTRALKDRRAKAEQVIYSKGCSSAAIMLTRYAAIIVMSLLPVILLSINPLLQSVYVAGSNGIRADYFAFLKAAFGWLLPTILFTVSSGFLFTEVTNGPVAILIQGIFWLVNIFMAGSNLVGYVGWNLIPRFNTVGSYRIYQSIFGDLVRNRIFYTVVAMFMLAASILIYDLKRKGRLHLGGTIRKDSKG